MAREVPLEEPWMAPKAAELGRPDLRHLGRGATPAPRRRAGSSSWRPRRSGRPSPRDVSLLHVLFYTHSGGGFNTLVGTDGGAQQDRFHGGSQRLALLMAEQLGAERVRLGAPVRRIEHGDDGVVLHADGPDGRAERLVRARRAIVAIPPTLAGRIAYDPPLPARRDQLTQRMPQGTVIKTMAIYERPFWRERGLSGPGDQRRRAGPRRLRQLAARRQPRRPARLPRGAPGAPVGRAAPRPSGARRSSPATPASSATRAARPERFIERVWAEEEWTRGCYGCLMTPGGWTEYGRALRAPIGPIHWAGAETATVWNGYMDGAVQSGERAAAEVARRGSARGVGWPP